MFFQGQRLEPATLKPEYHFQYSVNNEETGDFKSQEESRDGKSVVGRYTMAEPTGQVREVKYTADEVHGFRADVKMHPPGTFQSKNSEKRSAYVQERSDSEEKTEEVQSDRPSEENKEDQHADETKSSAELLHNNRPQQPEEMSDEEVEKTLEKQEHILHPHEHQHSNTDEEKSVDTESNEQTDNLIITVNAEKKAPAPTSEVNADSAKQPVHITHAVQDPMGQPAYPFIPQLYQYGQRIPNPAQADSPYPYAQRIPHPAAQADSAHHIPHPAVDHHYNIPHPAVPDHQLKTPAPLHPAAPVQAGAYPQVLPSFIYKDHSISPVSPLFIQQPSQHAHHFLPGNVQDILAAKQASIQDVENMVRSASAGETKPVEVQGSHGYQIHPKPMMFQLADPPVHLLLPSNQFDESYKALSYLSPNYPYNLPYLYQPSQDGLGRAGIPQHFIDHRNQADEAQKSILTNFNTFDFVRPLVNNIPPQYLPQKFRPVSSTAAPVNADQVSSTAQPHTEAAQQQQHVENHQVNKGQSPAPAAPSSPAPYFNLPFLYPLTTFLQRPFFHHQSQQAVQPLQTPVQQNQANNVQQDTQKVQTPQPVQSMPAPAANEQQRYYFLQPSFPTNGQYRYNPQLANPPPQQQKSAAPPMKPAALRAQPAQMQVPAPQPSHYFQEKSSNMYSFPYNSPVALLVLPMPDAQAQHTRVNENKAVRPSLDSYYKK